LLINARCLESSTLPVLIYSSQVFPFQSVSLKWYFPLIYVAFFLVCVDISSVLRNEKVLFHRSLIYEINKKYDVSKYMSVNSKSLSLYKPMCTHSVYWKFWYKIKIRFPDFSSGRELFPLLRSMFFFFCLATFNSFMNHETKTS